MRLRNLGAIIEETIRYAYLEKYFSGRKQGGTLLDLGCGPRPYLSLYRSAYTKTIGAEHPDAPFPKTDIDLYCLADNIPLEDNTIDTVLSTEVMHDMAEPSDMLSEVHRILKPGGEIVLTTPFVVPIVDGIYDHYRYTEQGLQYLLKKSGFTNITIQPVGDVFASAITLMVKPTLKFWNIIAKSTGIKAIYCAWNPFLFITVVLPQAFYLWTKNLPILSSLYKKFNYGCIGYITTAVKPEKAG